ncbi:MAG: hypothetical protein WCE52_18900 [Candidatus Acidiferrum sp.]
MARLRTTKKLAQRIDLNYFKRATPFKSAKLWLSVLVPLLALGWIAWRGAARDSRVYSSGRMSEAHAVLEKQCAACHVQQAEEFSSKAADAACLACHDGPVHHDEEVKAAVPACATCHMEHRGRVNITAASDQSCANCHANLKVNTAAVPYATHIHSLEDGHPEFVVLRDAKKDPATIALNHAIHMKPIRRGPNGPMVQLECADCHRAPATATATRTAAATEWKYADARYVAANVTYKVDVELLPQGSGTLSSPHKTSGRELVAAVKFATACAGCHLLTFDKRFEDGVPHDTPEIVHAFVVHKFQDYIAAHPSELRVMRDPNRELTGKIIAPELSVLSPSQWVTERTADAEELLWRKSCKQCHTLELGGPPTSLPHIAPARVTPRWLPHARFDHDAHRGFSCVGCHTKALTSTETADVLVPGITNCKTCHAPGPDHAESRCFECHTYHDWSKRKEVRPTFVMPGLTTGGK